MAGVAIEGCGALALTRVLSKFLFEVKPTDPDPKPFCMDKEHENGSFTCEISQRKIWPAFRDVQPAPDSDKRSHADFPLPI